MATIDRLRGRHPDLEEMFEKSYAYAVFPYVGRASVALAVTFGRGVVFEQHQPIGLASITELTLGVQVGGQTFSELMFFPSKETLEKLTKKGGEFAFAANASAVIVKAAASGTTNFRGVIAHAYSLGGMLLELSLGPQRIKFTKQEFAEEQPVVHEEEEVEEAEGEPMEAEEEEAEQPMHVEEEEPEHEERRTFDRARAAIGRAAEGDRPRARAKANQAREQAGGVRERVSAKADRGRSKMDEARKRVAAKAAEARERDDDDEDVEDVDVSDETDEQPVRARRPKFLKRLGSVLPALGSLGAGGKKAGGRLLSPVRRQLDKVIVPLKKEQSVSKQLHPAAQAALVNLIERNESLRKRLANAAGYAIFPSVGKAAAVLGATYGVGEVYEKGRLIGYAGLAALTLGVQVGGETFTELVIFDKPETLKRFKHGKVAFAANAAAVIVSVGAAVSRSPTPGAKVELATEGGMLLETAIGGQKIVFRPAALTRGRKLHIAEA